MMEWINVDGLGEIKIEKTLIFLDYPLLSTAYIDGDYYLIETVDNEEGIFLASRTTYRRILSMLLGKVDIKTALMLSKKLLYIKYDPKKQRYVYREVSSDNVPNEDLPDDATFYTIQNEDIEQYKDFILNKIATEDLKKKTKAVWDSRSTKIIKVEDVRSVYDVQLLLAGVKGNLKYVKPNDGIAKIITEADRIQPSRHIFNKCFLV